MMKMAPKIFPFLCSIVGMLFIYSSGHIEYIGNYIFVFITFLFSTVVPISIAYMIRYVPFILKKDVPIDNKKIEMLGVCAGGVVLASLFFCVWMTESMFGQELFYTHKSLFWSKF